MVSSSELSNLLSDFKKLVIAEDNNNAFQKITQIKKIIMDLDSLPPISLESPNAASEIAFAREALEYATLLSVNMSDKDSFQRNISCLRPYYTSSTVESDIMNIIIGLNLLFLLVENRLADFHCELQLLSETQSKHPAITFCTQLDQHLVVGSYDQVLVSAANPPTKYFSFFLKSLLETVRINIGECVAASYQTLSLKAATKILMFEKEEETLAFFTDYYPTWIISNGIISLIENKTQKSDEIPSLKLISQNLSYATELERIV